MSEYIHKSHNVTVLIYHLVFPAKYRRAVFDGHVDGVLNTPSACGGVVYFHPWPFMAMNGINRDETPPMRFRSKCDCGVSPFFNQLAD